MDPTTPASPSLDVALLSPVSVGVVAWRAPDPTLTIIVKVTLTLPEDGAARLAEHQEPLFLDEQGALGEPGDLDRASDFAPLKARADVLLAGFAYATSPMHVLSAGFAIDKVRKRFYAVAAEPSARTPLYPRYLRATPGPEGAPVQVGARAIWAGSAPGRELVSADGVPAGVFARGFDYGLFNVAPADQQLGLLGPTARLVLEGLVPGGDRRMVRLPGARPRVFSLPLEGAGGAAAARTPEETPLRCDTLWIDAGHERCSLTFRGVLPASPAGALPILVVAMDFGSEKQSWAALRAELDRAHWTRAATPESTREAALRGPATMPRPAVHRGLPTLDLGALAVSATSAASGAGLAGGRTQEIDARLVKEALPFKGDAPAARPLMVLGAFKGALASFARGQEPPPGAPPPSAPSEPAAITAPPQPDAPPLGPRPRALTIPFAGPGSGSALPFQPPAAPPALPFQSPAAPPAVPFAPAAQPAPFSPLLRFPAPEPTRLDPDPAPAPIVPAEPEKKTAKSDLLPLPVYAAIKAAAWAGRPLAEALRAQQIDEIRWYTNERKLAAALADSDAEAASRLSRALRRELDRAKSAPASGDGALPPPEPIKRRAKKERAPAAAKRVPTRKTA
ncbi:MAG: DUF2169 domain-containing protein [Byssovorax sp.]